MTVGSLLEQAEQRLRGVSETARLDAQLLLGELLSRGRGSLLAYPETIVASPVAERYWELVSRRATGEPLAYLLGRRDFYGREFVVDRRVLIPRPETELLIERALDLLAGRLAPIILDVGTGSGAIAVTLAAELPGATVIAADVSGEALNVAAENARRHAVDDRVILRQSAWLSRLRDDPLLADGVDLIAANLPYVGAEEADLLARDVRDFEPHLALFAGREGLDSITTLLDQIVDWQRDQPLVRPGGAILLEIGYAQGRRLSTLACHRFPCATVTVMPDLAGLDRLVEIRP